MKVLTTVLLVKAETPDEIQKFALKELTIELQRRFGGVEAQFNMTKEDLPSITVDLSDKELRNTKLSEAVYVFVCKWLEKRSTGNDIKGMPHWMEIN